MKIARTQHKAVCVMLRKHNLEKCSQGRTKLLKIKNDSMYSYRGKVAIIYCFLVAIISEVISFVLLHSLILITISFFQLFNCTVWRDRALWRCTALVQVTIFSVGAAITRNDLRKNRRRIDVGRIMLRRSEKITKYNEYVKKEWHIQEFPVLNFYNQCAFHHFPLGRKLKLINSIRNLRMYVLPLKIHVY